MTDNHESSLDRLEQGVNWWEQQTERAKVQLARDHSPKVCFAVVGLPKEPSLAYDFPPLLSFRPVEHPPGEIAIVRAIKKMTLFGAIGRYMPGLTYELVVPLKEDGDVQRALNLGWAFCSTLRIKTNADFLVPAVLDCSWEVVAAYDDHSRWAELLEDAPKAQRKSAGRSVAVADVQWTVEHLGGFLENWEQASFRLAAECFATHGHSGNPRYAATALWSGIEALFDIDRELTFRLATYIAAFLEPRGPARLDLYRKVVKLYNIRSKVVHGADVKPEIVAQHLNDASDLLSRLLRAIIEQGYPTRATLDELVFV